MHQALIEAHLGSELIGHISREGTAIEARERPAKPAPAPVETIPAAAQAVLPDATPAPDLVNFSLRV